MKKFVLMVAMVVSCVCMAQNSHAQTGRDGNTDILIVTATNGINGVRTANGFLPTT